MLVLIYIVTSLFSYSLNPAVVIDKLPNQQHTVVECVVWRVPMGGKLD